MNLKGQIESAETQFKQILEDFFISVFKEESLSSHGIEHHRRVWEYSKELLSILHDTEISPDLLLPQKLLIAAYMHDIGMVIEPGIRHGIHSRELCNRFLTLNSLRPEDYKDVLEAIEKHDLKDYQADTVVHDLLTILSVADDLDAFGFIGIYRYAEIYLTRNTDPEDIGSFIMGNAAKRFNHFIKFFEYNDQLIEIHKKRYLLLDDFFKEYNKQILSYQFEDQHPSGYCGVIKILDGLIKDKKDLRLFLKQKEQDNFDPVIRWFFNGLEKELTASRFD
jgi:HD superfamily phosphodiesterase